MATATKLTIAFVAGVVVIVALFPGSGAADWCYSLVGYRVPCGDGVNWVAGAGTAVVVGLALWLTVRQVLAAALAGLVVFAVLFPWGGGTASDPPTCFGMFGLGTVPCEGWPALAAGGLTTGVVVLVLWLKDRRN